MRCDITSTTQSFAEALIGCLSCGISQCGLSAICCCCCWLIAGALPASAVHPSSIDAISYTFASPLMTNHRGSPVKCKSFDALFKKQWKVGVLYQIAAFFLLMLPVSAANIVRLVWNASAAVHTFKYVRPPAPLINFPKALTLIVSSHLEFSISTGPAALLHTLCHPELRVFLHFNKPSLLPALGSSYCLPIGD